LPTPGGAFPVLPCRVYCVNFPVCFIACFFTSSPPVRLFLRRRTDPYACLVLPRARAAWRFFFPRVAISSVPHSLFRTGTGLFWRQHRGAERVNGVGDGQRCRTAVRRVAPSAYTGGGRQAATAWAAFRRTATLYERAGAASRHACVLGACCQPPPLLYLLRVPSPPSAIQPLRNDAAVAGVLRCCGQRVCCGGRLPAACRRTAWTAPASSPAASADRACGLVQRRAPHGYLLAHPAVSTMYVRCRNALPPHYTTTRLHSALPLPSHTTPCICYSCTFLPSSPVPTGFSLPATSGLTGVIPTLHCRGCGRRRTS